ncbi:MAG: DUF1579 domain-containing protein [Planctomycetes bacterium]|nr:DUF1579 domain-containing protein [Planctomycetota bacterium]
MLLAVFAARSDPEAPQAPGAQGEHAWLEQLVGEWEFEMDVVTAPSQSPQRLTGTESGRRIGSWAMFEMHGSSPGGPSTGILTLGYDPERGKYVGTWICSMANNLVVYEGALDAAGRILTLETEVPNPDVPGGRAKCRDIIEVVGEDQKTLTLMIEVDGEWHTFLTSRYRRKR